MTSPAEESPSPAIRALVVDDEQLVRWSVGEHLSRCGYRVETVESGEDAVAKLGAAQFDFMILDVRLPGIDGLAVLEHTMARAPEMAVIMISAHSTVDTAVAAMKRGAADFLVKPFPFADLDAAVERALALRRAQPEIARLEAEKGEVAPTLVGKSPAIEEVRELVARVAATETATVLIEGESGVGKEVVAHAIHVESARSHREFVRLNCSALPEQLFESALFGHERGAFTDAHSKKVGLVESAEGGTIFLDEIGDLPAGGQAKVLHLVENKLFRRVGGNVEKSADIRIIAATNASLEDCVAQGRFRQDLYFRLAVVPIHVPPLRERGQDVALLVGHFIDHFNKAMKRQVRGVAPAAMDMLLRYNWPGNVRELRNTIERALILNPDQTVLGPDHFPPRIRASSVSTEIPVVTPAPSAANTTLAETEKSLIVDALERTSGNQSKAAKLLGISRDALRYRMKKHDLL